MGGGGIRHWFPACAASLTMHAMSGKAAMKLSVIGRRVKHRRQKIKIEKIRKTNTVKDCTYTVSYDSGGRPSLVLCAEVLSDVSSSTYCVNFRFTQRTKLKLLHTGSVPYPYRIKWTMRKMRYQLRVSKLSLISGLIGLNALFNVKHILQ